MPTAANDNRRQHNFSTDVTTAFCRIVNSLNHVPNEKEFTDLVLASDVAPEDVRKLITLLRRHIALIEAAQPRRAQKEETRH